MPASRFAPAVHEKEKRREADKKKRASAHPEFIRHHRSDLLRGEKRERDAEKSGDKAAQPGTKQRPTTVAPSDEGRVRGNFEQSGKDVDERDELQNHRERKQSLKGFLHGSADKNEI